jgi:hypothetical protein
MIILKTYTQRELLFYSNGNFAYKRKNNSDTIKLTIQPKDIIDLNLSNSLLTIKTKELIAEEGAAPEDTFIFKFENSKEAKKWKESIQTYL